MPNLIHSTEHALPSMCTGQAAVYLERTIPELLGVALKPAKLWTLVEDDHYYDVYQVVDARRGRTERFYFDVTPFFGRGESAPHDVWLDLPEPNRAYPIWLFLGESDLHGIAEFERADVRRHLENFTIVFKQYSSEQAGYSIATRLSASERLEVTPVRSYASNAIPFLHGYQFYRLFVLHQVMHAVQRHDIDTTELRPDHNGVRPIPGRDCVDFTPLAPFDFARDFLNFLFWTHRPDAFLDSSELIAFAETARFAARTGLFTVRELRAALRDACIDEDLRQRLRSAIGVEAGRARAEETVDMVAH